MSEEIKKQKKPFNAAKFYRRTCLVIYDVISVIASGYLALLMRYNFEIAEIPDHFVDPITAFLPLTVHSLTANS